MSVLREIGFPFLVTLIAGLSTVVGALLVFFTDANNKKFLSVALGFSAGVMIYVSFMEIMPTAVDYLRNEHGPKTSEIFMLLGFLGGVALIAIIDNFVPDSTNPHNIRSEEEMDDLREGEYELSEFCIVNEYSPEECMRLEKLGFVTALGIAVHNFPEGLATFMSAMVSPELGISIAIAIALHNIPEGIAVAVPIFQSTGSKTKALKLTFLSGFAEPLGGIVGYFVLRPFMTDTLFGIVFAVVAGIMVYISLDELLPASREYGEEHLSIYGIVSGMAIMAISMIALG